MDPIERLADQELRLLSADLQVQLERGTAMRPVLYLLNEARKKAGKAILLFIDADPTDAKLMRRLQAEIAIYDDMVINARKLLAMGNEANQRVAEGDREEMEEIVAGMTDTERQLHGFERRGID